MTVDPAKEIKAIEAFEVKAVRPRSPRPWTFASRSGLLFQVPKGDG